MKICIPTLGKKGLDESVGEHFGRVQTYTIVDLDTDEVEIVPNTSHHAGGKGDPPEIMANNNVDVMICQGLGRRAINLFKQFGIEVYIGAEGTVKNAINAFKQGKLKKADVDSGCRQHKFRDRH